jgi:hypothetical protein
MDSVTVRNAMWFFWCLVGASFIALLAIVLNGGEMGHREALALEITSLSDERAALRKKVKELEARQPEIVEKVVEKTIRVEVPCRVTPVFPASSRTRASAGL